MTGISTSMRMMEMSIVLVEGVPVGLFFQQEVVWRKSRASPPWETTWTSWPSFCSCMRRIFWLTRLSSTTRMEYLLEWALLFADCFRDSSAREGSCFCGGSAERAAM